MARYEITSPDGRRFEVTAPDDAGQDDVLAYAQSNFGSKDQDGGGRSVLDVVSAGIHGIVDDVRGGISRIDARRREESIARSNAANQEMLATSRASGTSAELERQALAKDAAARYQNDPVKRGIDFGRDLALSSAQGVVGLGEAAVGIGDLATGWTGYTPGQALKDTVGYDPERTKSSIIGDLKSDSGKARDAIYQGTKGFTETLLTLGADPAMLADKITESLAGTVGAGAIGGKVVQMALPRVTAAASAAGLSGAEAEAFIADRLAKIAIGASAGAEGAQQAGNLAETARQGGKSWRDYALPAIASGIGTGAIAAGSGALAKKIGIGDIESDIALRGQRPGLKTDHGFAVNRAAIEGIKEGSLEEMPQSVQESAWENVAMGRPWDEGLGKAAASGLATGAGMGGGHAAVSRPSESVPSEPLANTAGGGNAIHAGDVLGSPVVEASPGAGSAPAVAAVPTESDKALYTPKSLTALDRVQEIDMRLAAPDLAQGEAQSLSAERDGITASWPTATPGVPTSFSTETGARINGQYALMEAGDLTTSHDENLRPVGTYPVELQPRERERHASEMQVQQIVGKLDPARLGESADAATGAPIVGADGLVESGNARTIALKRVYQANGQKALDYRQFLKDNAGRFGITPESVDALQKPVLVRVRSTPVNRAEFARQANASTVARMSPSEQARSDAAAIDSLDDLNPDDAGDFTSGSSRPFIRRFLAKLPGTEQAGMIDAGGQLSQAGYARIRNAVLAKAYGDSPVLLRMVESLDNNLRNVTAGLMRVAPQVAKAREAIADGALFDADITQDLMAAVEELATLRDKGTSVADYLAQSSMFGDSLSPEGRELLMFLADNIRSPRRIAEFIQAYLEALTAAGNPAQGSVFGEQQAPAKADLMAAAARSQGDAKQPGSTDAGQVAGNQGAIGQGEGQPANQAGDPRGAQGDAGASEWVAFPPESGTLGIPRADMPQIKGEHRGALIQFLAGQGITHETVEMTADQLKPTQAEFSTKKAEGWKEVREGSDRSVLASSDGYILDGHHQWVAALAQGETEKVILFNAPIRELLAATYQFPSAKRSDGATVSELRSKSRQDFKDALADLAQIATRHTRAAMMPEDTPNLMPTLVRLFDAGIKEVGYGLQDLIAYVKKALRADEKLRTFWNKIDNATYRKAAKQAIDQESTQRVDDLFAAATSRKEDIGETGNEPKGDVSNSDQQAAETDGSEVYLSENLSQESRQGKETPGTLNSGDATESGTTTDAVAEANSPIEIIQRVAKSRPFDKFDEVRSSAFDQLREKTGKDAADHDELRGSMMRDPVAEAIHEGQFQGQVEYAKTLPVHISPTAISMHDAAAAFSGTSHSPEQRGAGVRRGLFQDLLSLWRMFEVKYQATDAQKQAEFAKAFDDVAARYTDLTRAYLASHGRVMSAMIVGPARFPVAANLKRSDAASRRAQDASDYLAKAPRMLERVLHGATDNSVSSQLAEARQKLAEREKLQETMKAANAAIRKGDDEALRGLGFDDDRIAQLKKPDFSGRRGFADYHLANNNAEIKRIRQRVEDLQARAAEADAETESGRQVAPGVRMVKNTQDNRLQLFFDGKPADDVRADLRANGFKWAPSVSAWQRQLTANAISSAERIVGKHFGTTDDAGADVAPVSFLARSGDDASGPALAIGRENAESVVNDVRTSFGPDARFQLHLVESFDALPADAQQDARDQGGNERNTKGLIHRDGSIWVIRTNHSTAADLEETVLHELRGHLGTRKLFGRSFVTQLNNLFDRLGGWGGLKTLARKYGEQDAIETYRKSLFIPGKAPDWDLEVKIAVLTDELMARIAQRRPSIATTMKEIIGGIRHALRKHGLAQLADYGDTDLAYLIKRGTEALRNPETPGGYTVLNRDTNPRRGPTGEDIEKIRSRFSWNATGKNETGPMFSGESFSLEPVTKVEFGSDVTDFPESGEWPLGHARAVENSDGVFWFEIRDRSDGWANGRYLGQMLAEVNDFGEISAIHDMVVEPQFRGRYIGQEVVATIAANAPDGVRIVEALDQAKGFWNSLGARDDYDTYQDGRITWNDTVRSVLGLQGRDARQGEEAGARVQPDASRSVRPGAARFLGKFRSGQAGLGNSEDLGSNSLSRLNQSRPDTGRRIHLEDLTAVAQAFRSAFPGLPVHALETERQAPKELLQWIGSQNARGDWSAAVHKGEVYLLRSGLMDAEHAMEIAIHEAEHAGLERMFGQQIDGVMLDIYRSNPSVKAQADAIMAKYRYSAVRAANEVLADMGPTARNLSGWRKLLAKVRDILRSIRIAGKPLVMKWSDSDVEALVLRALAAAKRQAGKHVSTGTWTALARQGAHDFAAAVRQVVADSVAGRNLQAYPVHVMDSTPATLRAFGWDDLPVSMNPKEIDKVHFDHGMTADRIAQLVPETLERPSLMLRSTTREGRMVMVANEYSGKPVLLVVSPGADTPAGKRQLVVSMYPKGEGWDWVARQIRSGNLLYRDPQSPVAPKVAGAVADAQKKFAQIGRLLTGPIPESSAVRDKLKGQIPKSGPGNLSEAYKVLLPSDLRKVEEDARLVAIKELESRHGAELREIIGIEPGALTSSEAQYLLGFRTTDELRNRVAKAGQERLARLRSKGLLPEGQDPQGGVTRLSRVGQAGVAPTVEQRAEAIIQQKAATPRPVDDLLRKATEISRADIGIRKAFDVAASVIDRFTPETVKAGVISDYGVPEAVIDQRSMMVGRQKRELRAAGALIEKLATLTRAESRVAYEWMNSDNPQAADYFRDQLPPESIKTLAEVEKMIDQLSAEAVRLGQLTPEARDRNRFAYLHRSYVKHTAELTAGEAQSRARAIAVLGDQYKGRGMTDGADMAKIKNTAPEWWNRKLKAGQADKQLVGERFIRLERRAATGEGTTALPGMGEKGRGRLLEVAYWPAAEPMPARYGAWDQAGTWEARDTKGGKLILWRDFTKQEREALGEIDEVRYAIAKTLHGMIHDVEVGHYLEWLAQRYAKKEGEMIDGQVVEASERMRDTFKPGEWVKVPDTTIPGTKAKRYGVLSGRYLPGPIWNDVRQVAGGAYRPLGEVGAQILRAWKTSKTALSPAVHMNNVMSNFVMADWHDVSAGHILKALRLMTSKDAAAQEVMNRYEDSGGGIGTWATKELKDEQLRPLIESLEKELGAAGQTPGVQVGAMSAVNLLVHGKFGASWDAIKPTTAGRFTGKAVQKMIDMYQAEDDVFRLAAWLKAKENGASDQDAGKVARKSFLDYSINAPWIQAMRSTAFPFIAFTYRAVPMMLSTMRDKPWKLAKLASFVGVLNALGYLLSGGGEDDERKLLPEEKAGRVWGLVPKLVRMPWNDGNGSPVFLDIRRWIPVGDVLDVGQTHTAIPVLPVAVPGGPLALLMELAANKSQFTGREITLETDTPAEKAGKVIDHLWKAFAPNLPGLPGTYSTTAIVNSGSGKTDAFGREQSLTQAVVSSIGIKVGSYPTDVLRQNAQRAAQAKMMEIDRNITRLKRERQANGIDAEDFQDRVRAQQEKKRKIQMDLAAKVAGG
jgi:hypothetical protein